MNIQLSPRKILKDFITVWHEHGPEVDIVMDLKALTFASDSIETLCAFHVLDHLFPEETVVALMNWKKCLKRGGSLFIVVDDFEQIARELLSGEINVKIFNDRFTHPMQFTKDSLVDYIFDSGYSEKESRIWYTDVPNFFTKADHELVISTQKI